MNGPALLALQLLDSELDQIEQRRKRLPQRAAVDDATNALKRWTVERDRLNAEVESAYQAIERSEVAGAELDAKKRKLEAQLKTVIASREAEALMNEIRTLDDRHGELDDAELTAMEQQSEAETALEALTAIEPQVRHDLADAQAALDEALAALAAEEADVRARRGDADAALDDSDRATYATMRSRHSGVGFARLERHTCTACHVDLSQVEYEQVMAPSADLPECPHCGRFLVV